MNSPGLYRCAQTRVLEHSDIRGKQQVSNALTRSLQAQSRLSPLTLEVVHGKFPDVLKASSASSINEVLDAHTRRRAYGFDQLPFLVHLMVLIVAASSVAPAAYNRALRRAGYRLPLRCWARLPNVLVGHHDHHVDAECRQHEHQPEGRNDSVDHANREYLPTRVAWKSATAAPTTASYCIYT